MRFVLALLLLLAAPGWADTLRDVRYGAHPKQTFDVYLPSNASDAPILVMLHGGAWALGDKRNRAVWKEKSEYWGAQGFLFVSVNTRLLPDVDPVEQARDLGRAMRLVQERAAIWGGDADRVVLMGHSAGAHVALLLAVREDIRRQIGVEQWGGTLALDTAMTDVTAVMRDNPARLYRRAFGSDPAFWEAASPIRHASRGEGPFLLVCSSIRARPCPAARAFGQLVANTGGSATVLPVALRHGSINSALGQPSSYTEAVARWIERALE